MPIYEHHGVRPILGRDVYVAPTATVIGDVHLGHEVSIWFGAVLRGDCDAIRIGARTNIQDNAVVHVTGGKARTTIGEAVTVGHLALIHGCTVGDGCLVGMGSIVLDNAMIGDESIVAAGALVPPGMKVPPRSLVMGRPGKIVRAVTEADLTWVREGAELYLGYARSAREMKVVG
jgi:carbonic anhydrase/acetyltransferase-like protein (isoleucine patch superfamily)